MSGGWALHRDAALRMAGFPFTHWEALLPAGLTEHLSTLDDTWAAARRHRADLLTVVFPAAVAGTTDRPARRVLSRLRTRVGGFREVAADTAGPALRPALHRWNELLRAVDTTTGELRQAYPAQLGEVRDRLHRLAGDSALREAIGLLSANFGRAVDGYATGRSPTVAAGRDRGLEQRLVLYLQRLVAKNETNSFFGPIGAATIDPAAAEGVVAAGAFACGPPQVFSSPHVGKSLAALIAADPELAYQVPLRRSPMFDLIDGRLVHLPTGRARTLSEAEVAVWHRYGGTDPEPSPEDPGHRLIKVGALIRQVPIDLYSPEPLCSLRDWLDQRAHLPAAAGWLRLIAELRDHMRAFATASGPDRPGALRRLEQRIAGVTGQPDRRGAGRMYADRSVVFEERENRLRIAIGGDLAAGLPAELGPVLTYWAAVACQRWEGQQRVAAALFDRCWPGASRVPLPAYLAAAAGLPMTDEPTDAERYVDGLVGQAPGEVRLSPERLTHLTAAIDGPVFSSIDLMMTRPGTGPAGGRPRWVFGEAHAGHLLSVFPTDYFARRNGATASRERDRWLFDTLRAAGRRPAWLVTARDTKIFQYAQPALAVQLRPHQPDHLALPASRLSVRRERDRVTLCDGTGPLWLLPAVRPATTTFDPLAPLSLPAVQNVPFGTGAVRPRVVVGDTVAQRASWRVAAAPVTGLAGLDQLLAARAFRRDHGMPELVFVRLPWEPKPTLLDFRNPLSVSGFAGQLRNAPAGQAAPVVTVTEMLPGPEDLWLAGGHTFELRILAVAGGD